MEFRIFGFLGLLYGSFYRDPFLRLSSTAPWRVSSLLRALSISSPYPLASQKPFQPSLAVGGGLSGNFSCADFIHAVGWHSKALIEAVEGHAVVLRRPWGTFCQQDFAPCSDLLNGPCRPIGACRGRDWRHTANIFYI